MPPPRSTTPLPSASGRASSLAGPPSWSAPFAGVTTAERRPPRHPARPAPPASPSPSSAPPPRPPKEPSHEAPRPSPHADRRPGAALCSWRRWALWALSGRDRLDAVPAAVVNLDEGAEVTDADGETQTVPSSLCCRLPHPGPAPSKGRTPRRPPARLAADRTGGRRGGPKDGSYRPSSSSRRTSRSTRHPRYARGVPGDPRGHHPTTMGQINALVALPSPEAFGEHQVAQPDGGAVLTSSTGFNDLAGDGFSDAADAEEPSPAAPPTWPRAMDGFAGGTRSGRRHHAGRRGARVLRRGVDLRGRYLGRSADGARTLADGLDDLATGTEELAGGVEELQTGMRAASRRQPAHRRRAARRRGRGDGTAENPGLEAGADQLATGLEQFAGGVSRRAPRSATAPRRTPDSPPRRARWTRA